LEQLVNIELFGQPYTFRTDSEFGAAKRIADTVAEEVARIEEQQSTQASNKTKLTVMILAALNIANENHELKLKYSDMFENISERSTRLIRLLDAGLT
jgi:cell division protein ZapA (FtsZ GTPase activity inhibitor)